MFGAPRDEIISRVETYRTPDGTYNAVQNSQAGNLYGCFIALGAYEDLGAEIPDPDAMLRLVDRLRATTGGYSNQEDQPTGLTPSTATALHALAGLHADFENMKEPCLDFIDSLWTSKGAFYGHWGDNIADCEYTYYALLALGHLSL